MLRRMRLCILAALALFAASAAPAQPLLQGATGELAARLLADHAASYGPVLASLRHLVHSPRESRPGERENLAMAWHGTLSPEDLVAMWSKERLLLEPGSHLFPGASRTGNWEDIAHYTQMVWPTTTHVGCAIFAADWDYLICRYSPPGNKDGKPIFVTAAAVPVPAPETSGR